MNFLDYRTVVSARLPLPLQDRRTYEGRMRFLLSRVQLDLDYRYFRDEILLAA